MLRLRFSGVTRPHGVFVGPAPWFRLGGRALIQGPDGQNVAEMRGHQWILNGLVFHRFDCRHPLSLLLEGPDGAVGEEFGEFDECAMVDGAIFAESNCLAEWLPDKNLWLSRESDAAWPVMLIQAGELKRPYPLRV